jgi:glycerol-1-phosphate dehydrogenase [NAD(P)+]
MILFSSEEDPMTFVPDTTAWPSMTASEITQSLLGRSFECPSCGRTHGVRTKVLETRPGVASGMSDTLRSLDFAGRPLVLFDRNTWSVCGDDLMEGLASFDPVPFIFQRDDLHADEHALGSALAAAAFGPSFLVSAGSGTLTDITRYSALRAGLPFAAFATAASVDGFASSVTPLIVNGFKRTYPGKAPLAIFADPDVLAAAPRRMTAAGFGDVLAKTTALLDWRIAHETLDEDYCALIAALVDKAVQECIALAGALARQEPAAAGVLCDVLALTGIAMQLMGNSRPASGGDHHVSHLLEMRDIQAHRTGSLHGDKVGIGTLVGMTLYLRMFGDGGLPAQRPTMSARVWEAEVRRVYGPLADAAIAGNPSEPPTGEAWENQKRRIGLAMESFGYETVRGFRDLVPAAVHMITDMGGPVRPGQLGYSVQDAYDAIAFGKEVNPKFTMLRMAERYGWLYDLAAEISAGLDSGEIY